MTNDYSKGDLGLWPDNSDVDSDENSSLWPDFLSEFEPPQYHESTPSAPIILISAAVGLLFGIIAFYLTYGIIEWGIEISAASSFVFLFLGVCISSVGLSSLTRSSAFMGNLAFSCGLVLLSTLFFGLCTVSGALGATILLLFST